MNAENRSKVLSWTLSLACKTLAVALVLTATAGTSMAVDVDVPEIDPGSATSAMALLSGGVMLLVDRFRRK